MCFFIAGVQPKTKTLEQTPQRCPRCGLNQAYQQRIDHYLSLFFIPLIRVKQGEAFIYCRHCRLPLDHLVQPLNKRRETADGGKASRCIQCGSTLQTGFKYCPHCGQRQH